MGRDETATAVVVADAGPLIHLDELGVVGLLEDFSRVIVPVAVWEEVARHRPGALNAPFLEKLPPPPVDAELQTVGMLYTLHRGEWQALAICAGIEGSRLLTDDTAARLAAKALRISASGTIGILLRALRRGLLDKERVRFLLESIPARSSLHIKQSLLDEIITEIDNR